MTKPRHVLKLKGREERRSNKNKKNVETRWKKGHSCESNPTARKFRDGASNLHFQLHAVGNNPLLTVGNLGGSREDDDLEDDVLSEDVQSLTISDARTRLGSFSSCKTFASGWSKCSNGAFQRFLGRFKVDSALHKEMLSILAATTEVINSMDGKQTETEYFAIFISTLDSCQPEQYHPMMALVCMIIGKVSEAVIRLKFKDIYPKISLILASAIETNEHTLIRLCCDALGKILKTQEGIVSDPDKPDSYSTYYAVLKCCLHDNPKVRRKARQVIGGLLNRQNEKQSANLSKLVLGWILDQLVSYPTCGPKTACDVLGLLQFTWTFVESINSSASKKVFESALRVMSGGDSSIVKIGFILFSTVFQKGFGLVPEDKPEDSLTPKLVSVLWDLRPDWRNNEAFKGWIKCILDGTVRLLVEEDTAGQKYLPRLIEAVSPSWPSSFGKETAQLISDYMEHIISKETDISVIEDSFQLLSKNLIAIPPNPHCLAVLEGLLGTLSHSHFGSSSRDVFLQLVPLYSTNTSETVHTLGRFVNAFGVENLWNSVEQVTRRSVILPLLRENLCEADISFWKNNILPLTVVDASDTTALAVWDSFVGFCRDPVNVENFPAEIVGKHISTKPLVRLCALAGIRQFGLWPQAKPILVKYSKNFIPLLFNLYVKEAVKATKEETRTENSGHAEAILLTVKEYLQFCDADFLKDLVQRAINKVTIDVETVDEERPPLFDLIATLIAEQVDCELLPKLIEISAKLAQEAKHQKRCYRILNAMVKNQNLEISLIKNAVLDILRSSKGKSKSNAEALRLDCINYLCEKDPALIDEFLPEAVLNLLSVNTKSRKLAIRFGVEACKQLKSVDNMMGVIQVGLKSPNSFVRACTINFMTLVFLEIKPKQPNGELIQACIDQIKASRLPGSKSASAEADGSPCKESLGFLSLNLSLFKSLMGPYASSIGQAISLPGNPRKEINKILARMIKVFGAAGLKAVLPNSNDPKMNTRIKNLEKKIRKLKDSKSSNNGKERRGEDQMDDKDGNMSDESDEEIGGAAPTSKRTLSKRGLIIKEGVVDFLDPKNVTGALISKPKESKAGDQFKLSEDGKLIIEMEEEMDKASGGKGSRKRKIGLSDHSNAGASDDEEDDYHHDNRSTSNKSVRSSKSSRTFNSSSKSTRSFHSSKSSKSTKSSAKVRPKKARF